MGASLSGSQPSLYEGYTPFEVALRSKVDQRNPVWIPRPGGGPCIAQQLFITQYALASVPVRAQGGRWPPSASDVIEWATIVDDQYRLNELGMLRRLAQSEHQVLRDAVLDVVHHVLSTVTKTGYPRPVNEDFCSELFALKVMTVEENWLDQYDPQNASLKAFLRARARPGSLPRDLQRVIGLRERKDKLVRDPDTFSWERTAESDPGDKPFWVVDGQELDEEQLHKAIGPPGTWQEVLRLKFAEDLTSEEIRRVLGGASAGAIRAKISRELKKLHKKLTPRAGKS